MEWLILLTAAIVIFGLIAAMIKNENDALEKRRQVFQRGTEEVAAMIRAMGKK